MELPRNSTREDPYRSPSSGCQFCKFQSSNTPSPPPPKMASVTASTPLSKTPSTYRFQSKTHQKAPTIIAMKPPNSAQNSSRRLLYTTRASSAASAQEGASSPGLYSAKTFELTVKNVDLVLEDVRPYLIADGGNVDVVAVDDGVISLQLQGACGSCPSSTTTMKMGIERVLKEKFGDAVKDIRQVFNEQPTETTVEAINGHLDILRPAIKNFGGSVEVMSVDGGDCVVKYTGPESIGSGVKAAIKERFPDIINVVLT